ncbi:hypothetical protein CPLU01_00505 [Colletotrichum plurivorum]|uniref:Uncharacterized protein n=1 Tax=Colletotrichum plurivorum TaxID=2175906 RepID=A0A8H6NS13_9PEZI|nr:hypothetical protein CPLU01_00505 [Colletotrichum plurivorum]
MLPETLANASIQYYYCTQTLWDIVPSLCSESILSTTCSTVISSRVDRGRDSSKAGVTRTPSASQHVHFQTPGLIFRPRLRGVGNLGESRRAIRGVFSWSSARLRGADTDGALWIEDASALIQLAPGAPSAFDETLGRGHHFRVILRPAERKRMPPACHLKSDPSRGAVLHWSAEEHGGEASGGSNSAVHCSVELERAEVVGGGDDVESEMQQSDAG